MILIDNRAGSVQLVDYIKPRSLARLAQNLPTDVVFQGNGPGGQRITIGIEHKKIPDVLACIHDGRFAGHQLGLGSKAVDFFCLMIEGLARRNKDNGTLELYHGQKGWVDTSDYGLGLKPRMWIEYEHWLFSMFFQARVFIWPWQLFGKMDCARAIVDLYHYFNNKEWDEHRSHLAIDDSDLVLGGDKSQCFRSIRALPGCDLVTAQCAEQVFGSARAAYNAGVDEWSEVKIGRPGKRKRRIGKKRAIEIVEAIERDER